MKIQHIQSINNILKTRKNNNSIKSTKITPNDSVSFKGKSKTSNYADDPTLMAYFKKINKYDLLSDKEELELAKKIAKGGGEAEIAKKKLILANLRYVVSVAKKFRNPGLPLHDLIQDGNKGLIKAADRFDHKRNVKFISYATNWIEQSIRLGIAENGRTIKIPLSRIQKTTRLNRKIKELAIKLKRKPTDEEIAKETTKLNRKIKKLAIKLKRKPTEEEIAEVTNKSIKEIREKRELPCETTSLETPIGYSNRELIEIFKDPESEHVPVDESSKRELRERLEKAISGLTPKNQEIMKLRFDIEDGDDEGPSLQQIGDLLNITRERVRQRIDESLKKIAKNPALQVYKKEN